MCTHLHGLVFFFVFLNTLTQAKGGRLREEEEEGGRKEEAQIKHWREEEG